MFFTILMAAPILVGLVAGVSTGRRRVPRTLAGLWVALGVGAATVSAFNPDGRFENISFSLVAGVVCAGLFWLGHGAGRVTRRRPGTGALRLR